MASPDNTKICSLCKVEQPLSNFGRRPEYRDGYRGQCNPCRSRRSCEYQRTEVGRAAQRRAKEQDRARRNGDPSILRSRKLLYKYGLSLPQYETILAAQGGRCSVCRTVEPHGKHGVFVVDHCHSTGRVRGLLCNGCNMAIGKLGDDIKSIERVLAYLKADVEQADVHNAPETY